MRSVRGSGRARAQSIVGLAVALPFFLFVLIGAFQLLLSAYVQQVALGAAQDAARLAASRDATAEDAAVVAGTRARDLPVAIPHELGAHQPFSPFLKDAPPVLRSQSQISKPRTSIRWAIPTTIIPASALLTTWITVVK